MNVLPSRTSNQTKPKKKHIEKQNIKAKTYNKKVKEKKTTKPKDSRHVGHLAMISP